MTLLIVDASAEVDNYSADRNIVTLITKIITRRSENAIKIIINKKIIKKYNTISK